MKDVDVVLNEPYSDTLRTTDMSFGSSVVPPVREGFVMTSSNNQISDGMTSSVPGYSGNRAAAVVGITYRQLDYWARTDLVRPSITEARGSGSRRLYSYRNLLELRMVKNLLDAGIKLESVRDAFKYLQDRPDADITSAHLVINGSSVVLCQGDELIDVVRRGQGVLNLLPLAQVKDQVDGQLISLEAISQKDVEASTLADRRVGRTG